MARAADGEADAEVRRDRGDRLLLMLVGFVPWVAAAEAEVSVAGVREARFLAPLMRTWDLASRFDPMSKNFLVWQLIKFK